MSSLSPQQGARRSVASFATYPEAQQAVDLLSDRRFPVERVAIIGEDLRFVEQVTGRQGFGRAALSGLASGAATGALVGALLGLFTLFSPLVSALVLATYGLVIGAVAGLLLGLLSHALSGGRRDFSSVSAVSAGRYDLLVDAEVADDAARLLAAGARS